MEHRAVAGLIHNQPLDFTGKRPGVAIIVKEEEALECFLKLIHFPPYGVAMKNRLNTHAPKIKISEASNSARGISLVRKNLPALNLHDGVIGG